VRAPSEVRILGQNPIAKDPVNLPARKPTVDQPVDKWDKVDNPVGEWNTCDIICRGGALTVTINGVLENEIAGASLNAGAIGLQSEIAPVEYRNIRIAPLPPR